MTITVSDDYVLGASKVLSFQDEDGFDVSSGAPSLQIRGGVSVLGEQDGEFLRVFAGGAAPVQITLTSTASIIMQQTGTNSVPAVGEFTAAASVVNHGLVEVQSASLSGTGFIFHAAGQFTNTGMLSVATTGGAAIGVEGADAHTTNSGLIQVTGRAQTVAVQGALSNSGDIRAIATNDVTGVDATGDFDNSGRIVAHCAHGGAVGVMVEAPMGFSFDNQGSILATGPAAAAVEIASTVANPGVGRLAAQTLENSGLIKGGTAILALGGATAAALSLHNTGEIRGAVLLGDAQDSIVNTGKIAGSVLLGGGDDVFSTDGGVVKGSVYGGLGDDLVTGGRYADWLYGDTDSPGGEDGADTLIGGKGADTLIGGGGADHFVYRTVNDSTAAHADVIADLQDGDIVDLSAIDADRTTAGDQGFFFVTDFDGRAGEARMTYDSAAGLTHLELDVNGDMQADSVILIVGDHRGFEGFAV